VDPANDADSDCVPDGTDNCRFGANPSQDDSNSDGIGDVCSCTDDEDCGGYPSGVCVKDLGAQYGECI